MNLIDLIKAVLRGEKTFDGFMAIDTKSTDGYNEKITVKEALFLVHSCKAGCRQFLVEERTS